MSSTVQIDKSKFEMKLKSKSQYFVRMNKSRRKQQQSFFNLRLNIYAQYIGFPTKRKAASDCKQ